MATDDTEMHRFSKNKYSSQSNVSYEIPLTSDTDDYESWSTQYNDSVDQIQEWCSAQENLDVYQMNSFYAGISNRRAQMVNYYKTAMVFFIQTGGGVYLAYSQIKEGVVGDNTELCATTDFGWLSWMAFSFTGFISMTLNDQLSELSVQGVYRFKKNLPPFFNKFWLSTGIFINMFVLIVSWVVSIVVIFLSVNPLDMILNSLAVYFIIELDDMMVNRVDYEYVEVWLKDELEMWMRAKYANRQQKGYEYSCIDRCGRYILKCSTITEKSCTKWIIRFFAFTLPFVVLVCFNQTFSGVSNLGG